MASFRHWVTLLGGIVAVGGALSACGSDSEGGSAEQALGVECSAHVGCGVDAEPCAAGLDCVSIPGCNSALCISIGQACLETCGKEDCGILESYPLQIDCGDHEPVPGRGGPPGGSGGEPNSCEELEAAFAEELAQIQACTEDAECGQELRGTSCGCTRNLVARTDADLTGFSRLLSEVQRECEAVGSTCDCPQADGFACREGLCSWNYTESRLQ